MSHLTMSDTQLRLDVLSSLEILDTAPEPEFDDIAQIARDVCATPVALVSLVADDRQWFKARLGFEPCETPIGQSVCAHALAVDAILVIPDLTADPRTNDNTLVSGPPHIRFYAGAVLRMPDGVAIGSLCVIDTVPRPEGLTSTQTDILLALARQVIAILNMRLSIQSRDAAIAVERAIGMALLDRAKVSEAAHLKILSTGARQTAAQEAGGIGTFEVDVESDRCAVSAEFCRIFGLPPQLSYSTSEIHSVVLPEDRRHLTTRQARSEGTGALAVEFRVRRAKDGAIRWVGRRAEFRTGPSGMVQTMVGVVFDVTERKLAELRATALIQVGDLLREAKTSQEAVLMASRVLGDTLTVSRAGYAAIDLAAQLLRVDADWTASGISSVVGTYPLDRFRAIADYLTIGSPLSVANVPALSWLASTQAAFAAMDVKAAIFIPLLSDKRLVGVLFVHNARPRTWSSGENEFALAVADRAHAAIAKIEAEEQQRILNDELSHRLKNTLAMVQAIVNQTLRGVTDADVVSALEERIIALSKAHDVLLQQSWASARIATVLEQVLGLHAGETRFDIEGPNLTLGAKATLSLSLLLHELATNALKYGALSVAKGRVEIRWRLETTGADQVFALSWREVGGPPASPPKRRGFGSRLIGMGIAGAGRAKLDYSAAGLIAEFKTPLHAVSAN